MSYEGLCLGGPFDGERRVCDHYQMEAMEREYAPLSWRTLSDAPLAAATVQGVVYRHRSLKADGKEFSFWVLVDYLQRPHEVGPRDVMERLIENYRPMKKFHGRDVVVIDGRRCIPHPVE